MATTVAPTASTPAPTATPPQTSSTPAPTSSPAPAPAQAQAPAQPTPIHAPTDAPGTASTPAPLPAPTATFEIATENQPPQTRRQRLDVGDRGWMWKLALRTIACISAIIGIGCIAWAYSTVARGPYAYEMDDQWSIVWSLITFGLSLIWCFICIVVYLLRCPHRPVHPGAQVGVDLILWLAFIPTGLLCVAGALSVVTWGSSGVIGEYSSYGYYTHANNGTWVWNATEYDSELGRDRVCNGSSSRSYYYYEDYGFASCAEEDAYVNNLWKEKPRRAGAEVTGTVCQFLNLILHFTLFVWACVDTHRRRSKKVSKEAEVLASQIVMRMVTSGAVVRPPNEMAQPLLRPEHQQPMQYQPMQPQWMQQYQPQQPQQPPVMSGGLGPGPSGSASGPGVPAQAAVRDEKQMSARFA